MSLDRQTASELQFMAQAGASPQAVNAVKNISTLAYILLGWTSVTVEVFLRHGFGERYLSPLRCIVALMTIRIYLWFPSLIQYFRGYLNPFAPDQPFLATQGSTLFINMFILLCIVHLIRIWVRNNVEGKPWHSYSFGISNLAPLISFIERIPGVRQGGGDWLLYRAVEPALVLLFAWMFRNFSPTMGWWFVFAGIALLLRNNLAYTTERGRYLDILDARIESHYFNQLQEIGSGNYQSKRETAGYSVVPVPQRILNELRATDIEATVANTMGGTNSVPLTSSSLPSDPSRS